MDGFVLSTDWSTMFIVLDVLKALATPHPPTPTPSPTPTPTHHPQTITPEPPHPHLFDLFQVRPQAVAQKPVSPKGRDAQQLAHGDELHPVCGGVEGWGWGWFGLVGVGFRVGVRTRRELLSCCLECDLLSTSTAMPTAGGPGAASAPPVRGQCATSAHLSSRSSVSSSLNSRANLTSSLASTGAPARTCGDGLVVLVVV